ncbi:DsbA family protein [Gleimia coleocanis]|nr:thioredoxin domain-containing protein [Gleimia coleocanis]
METNKRLQLILVAVAAVLAIIIAFYMGMHFGKSSAEMTSQKPPSTAAMTAEKTEMSAESKDAPVADPNLVAGQDYSPSQTDPEVLKLMAAEIHRDKDDLRSLGSPDAPVVLVSYEDFSCPMCGVFNTNTHPALKKLVDEGKLRLEFRDMVIFPNYNSQLAHQGARAAAQQGKFWEFVDKAFAQTANGNHPNYTKELVLDIAKQAGVENLSAFEKALESDEIVQAVQAETQHAREKLGLTGTPFFIINNAVVSGAYPTEYFINTINQQAVEAK